MTLLSRIFDFLFGWMKLRRNAGRILLDVGPLPDRWLFLGVGVFQVCVGLLDAYVYLIMSFRNHFHYIAVIMLGTLFIMLSFGHIQICQNGILLPITLLKWERIESFEWSDYGNYSILKMTLDGRLPAFLRKRAIRVPVEKRSQVHLLLEQFVQK